MKINLLKKKTSFYKPLQGHPSKIYREKNSHWPFYTLKAKQIEKGDNGGAIMDFSYLTDLKSYPQKV